MTTAIFRKFSGSMFGSIDNSQQLIISIFHRRFVFQMGFHRIFIVLLMLARSTIRKFVIQIKLHYMIAYNFVCLYSVKVLSWCVLICNVLCN